MKLNVRKMVLCSLFASLITVCAWISIPIPPVSFTLQTFGVLMALGVLGGKWGSISILLYLLMGIVGIPVFAGFQGGTGVLFGATGGFLWGFLIGALGYRLTEKAGKLPAMILCQLICSLCGCLWFEYWAGGVGVGAAVLTCVVPYLIPDGLKIWLAWKLSARIRRQLKE